MAGAGRAGLYDLRFEGAKAGPRDRVERLRHGSRERGQERRAQRLPDGPVSRQAPERSCHLPPAGRIHPGLQKNEDTKVSPHFRLKQFVCKQGPPDEFPKYIALHERLPLKLEAVLQLVNSLGFDVETLNVMSGYRTPFYNHAIGDVLYSMHQWGSAADVFVDTRKKGVMDDLTRTAASISKIRNPSTRPSSACSRGPGFERFQGGMGYYPPTSAHPPFVHVDVRGTKARWKG